MGKALAQHECQGGHNCDGEAILDIGGDRVLALSNSLGGVDISGCVVTKQRSYLIIFSHQFYEYEPWCLAGILDENSKYKEAAIMRCTDKETAKIYGDDCTTVLNFEPFEIPEPKPTNEWDNDWEEKYVAQQQEIEMVREEAASKQSTLEAKLDADAVRRARAKAAGDKVRKGEQ